MSLCCEPAFAMLPTYRRRGTTSQPDVMLPSPGAKLEEDAFGKAMLDSGIPKETIMHWTKDPQARQRTPASRLTIWP